MSKGKNHTQFNVSVSLYSIGYEQIGAVRDWNNV